MKKIQLFVSLFSVAILLFNTNTFALAASTSSNAETLKQNDYISVYTTDYYYENGCAGIAKFTPEVSGTYEIRFDNPDPGSVEGGWFDVMTSLSGAQERMESLNDPNDWMYFWGLMYEGYNDYDVNYDGNNDSSGVIFSLEAGRTYGIVLYVHTDFYNSLSVPVTVIKHTHVFTDVFEKGSFSKDGFHTKECLNCQFARYQFFFAVTDVSVNQKTLTYSEKALKPSVIVKDSSGKSLVNGQDYTLSYKNNINPGKGCVTIKLIGNYTGSKNLYFTINPKKTSIIKANAKKKAIAINWKKQSKQTSGYQIQYSTSKSFKSGTKTINIKKNTKTSTVIKNLKNNKKYYIRIRTYKNVNGKKYYSAWSAKKTTTTK